jgi:hypothetical protein
LLSGIGVITRERPAWLRRLLVFLTVALRALPSGGSPATLRGCVGWFRVQREVHALPPGARSAAPHGRHTTGAIGSATEIEAANAVSNETETALAIQAQAHAVLALAATTTIGPGWQRYGWHDVAGVRYSTA